MKIPSSEQRAAVFIDGGNFFHRVGAVLRKDVNTLDYAAFGRKLVAPRRLSQIRYYAGRVANTEGARASYAAQRRLLSRLKGQNVRVRLGRIEKRQYGSEILARLREWLEKSKTGRRLIAESARNELEEMCGSAKTVWQEKGVDMMCGIDMVSMAFANEYDVAYLVSGDGDFAPAIEMVRGQLNKRVFVCSPEIAYHLRGVANKFIQLDAENFRDCWL